MASPHSSPCSCLCWTFIRHCGLFGLRPPRREISVGSIGKQSEEVSQRRKGTEKTPKRVPWGGPSMFIQIAFFSTLDRPWPEEPQGSMFKEFPINFGILFEDFLFVVLNLFSSIFCITPLLLPDWLHNCTNAFEAPHQNGGEIDGRVC